MGAKLLLILARKLLQSCRWSEERSNKIMLEERTFCTFLDKEAVKKIIDNIPPDEEAVKEKLNSTNFKAEKFEDVYEKVKDAEFWKFRDKVDINLQNLPREPAYLFLELVREITSEAELQEKTVKHAKECLEDLPDINKLKPTVWASHKLKRGLLGVSLGVRSFVRPLFLYVKLVQLRENRNNKNSIDLSETEAFEQLVRDRLPKKKKSEKEKSKYEEAKDPCASCCVFFHGKYNNTNQLPIKFNIFGNCAEYDVIKTANLDLFLNQIALTPWVTFESACQEQFEIFKNCIYSCKNEKVEIDEYAEKMTQNSKILKYQQQTCDDFKLIAIEWPPPKSEKSTRKRKIH